MLRRTRRRKGEYREQLLQDRSCRHHEPDHHRVDRQQHQREQLSDLLGHDQPLLHRRQHGVWQQLGDEQQLERSDLRRRCVHHQQREIQPRPEPLQRQRRDLHEEQQRKRLRENQTRHSYLHRLGDHPHGREGLPEGDGIRRSLTHPRRGGRALHDRSEERHRHLQGLGD